MRYLSFCLLFAGCGGVAIQTPKVVEQGVTKCVQTDYPTHVEIDCGTSMSIINKPVSSLVKTFRTDPNCVSIADGMDTNLNGILDTTEFKNVETVCNGQQGVAGLPGLNGRDAVIEIIDPCGDKAGVHDEVLLKLSTGQLLASFSDNENGKNTRFSILTEGRYKTTDGSNCQFSVNSNNEVIYE